MDKSLVPALLIVPCYTGSDSDPEELRTLRSAPGLVDDGLRTHTFIDQQLVIDSAYGENRHYWKGHFVRELPDELIDELIARLVVLGTPPGGVLIESLHGAPKDAAAEDGVVGFRRAAFNVSVMATWQTRPSTSNTSGGRVTPLLHSSRGRSAAVATSTTCRPTSRSSAFARHSALRRSPDSRRPNSGTSRTTSCGGTRTSHHRRPSMSFRRLGGQRSTATGSRPQEAGANDEAQGRRRRSGLPPARLES